MKLPLTLEGLKACKTLEDEGHPCNVTLCFSAVQALLAAKAGATFISPFLGRLDDGGQDGMELIREIRAIYDNYDYPTQILAASIRTAAHVRDAAIAGADCATIPPAVFKSLYKHHPDGFRACGVHEGLGGDGAEDSLNRRNEKARLAPGLLLKLCAPLSGQRDARAWRLRRPWFRASRAFRCRLSPVALQWRRHRAAGSAARADRTSDAAASRIAKPPCIATGATRPTSTMAPAPATKLPTTMRTVALALRGRHLWKTPGPEAVA